MCRVLNYMIFLCIQMILESTKLFRTLQMKSRKNQKLAVITMDENKKQGVAFTFTNAQSVY